ncbi:hypothetical protein M9Y10_000038 [Tritrichomonas musculus]|uniref:Inner centromere protein ARK-binding domain-containing protein n=1 Tax=Tritrichomonas musculus TaxID=1915356 RepID=A0ABR2L354_9EUKA
MDLLFHGFQIPDHNEVYSRMNLISAVPLKVDTKDENLSAKAQLDQTIEGVSNVLSKHTRNIDCWLSTHDKCKSKKTRQEVLLPFDRGPTTEYQNDVFIASSKAIEKAHPNAQDNSINTEEIQQQNDEEEQINEITQEENINIEDSTENQININEEIESNSVNEYSYDADNSSGNSIYGEGDYDSDSEIKNEEKVPEKKQEKQITPKETSRISHFDSEEIETAHRFKALLKTRNMSPEPCTYDPNFEAVLPTINVPQLPPREDMKVKKKQIEAMSPTEILNMYNNNLRNFDPNTVHIRNFENLYIHYPNEEKNVYDYIPNPQKPDLIPISETESMSSAKDDNSILNESNNLAKSKNYSLSNHSKKIGDYQTKSKKIRSFKNTNIINIENNDNYILRPTSTLASKVPRDEIFRSTSAAKHLSPGEYNLPQQEPPVVLNMSNLHDRDCLPTKKGSPRIYPLAVEQADNLRPKKPFHKFSSDTSRETKTFKNRRIEILDQFKKEKQDLINEICKKSAMNSAKISAMSSSNDLETTTNSKKSNSKKMKIRISEFGEDGVRNTLKNKDKEGIKKRMPFDIQSSRPSIIYPRDKNSADDPDPIYPFDPIESFKKTKPGVKYVTIRSRPKPLSGEKFWTTTWYGT